MQQLTAGRPSGFRGLFNANRYILCSSLFAVIGSFLYGTDQGVLSNLLTGENFGAHFPKVYSDAVLKGWVVSVLQLGAWLGALLNGPLANKISRKYSIMVAAFVSCLLLLTEIDADIYAIALHSGQCDMFWRPKRLVLFRGTYHRRFGCWPSLARCPSLSGRDCTF